MFGLAKSQDRDIFFATHRASKFQNRPSLKLWRWIERISEIFGKISGDRSCLPSANDQNSYPEENSASRTGWFYEFYGANIAWSSEILDEERRDPDRQGKALGTESVGTLQIFKLDQPTNHSRRQYSNNG